jgi:Sulfotransferase family
VTLAERDEVIFVGGTPFSGMEVVAGMLGAQPGVAAVPVAARFHSDPRGIPALLTGRIGLEDFVRELRGHGRAELVPPERLDAALTALRDSYHSDPLQSCRELFWALIEEILGEADGATVVEASPGNLIEAQTLARLVPQARFVHVVRDGRDVAAAAIEADSGPRRLTPALEWWADRLRDAEHGIRGEEDGAPYAIPDERFAMVVLDELASGDGEAAYRNLLVGIGLDGGDSMRSFAAIKPDPAAIGHGRWREHARGPAAWRVSRRYAQALRELNEEGNHAAAALLGAYERWG